MTAKLSEIDLKWIRAARSDGILEDIDAEALDFSNGMILHCCSDGDQFHHVYSFFSAIVEKQAGFSRIHPLPMNGGAIILSPESAAKDLAIIANILLKDLYGGNLPMDAFLKCISPLAEQVGHLLRLDRMIMWQIRLAMLAKKMKTVVLSAHAPCSIANLCCMSFADILYHMNRAKERLEDRYKRFGGIFPLFFQADYGSTKEIYFVRRHKSNEWLMDNHLINPALLRKGRFLPF